MKQPFAEILAVGGKSNSLGRADEVIEAVLQDGNLLEDLCDCLFDDDAWVRMRAADCLEKVCRTHPEWLLSYIDRFEAELLSSNQPSIQWHMAQIYRQVDLTPSQKQIAISWLKQLLSTVEVDWIVAANSMDTLRRFVNDGSVPSSDFKSLLEVQSEHKSKSVVKRASKYLNGLPS